MRERRIFEGGLLWCVKRYIATEISAVEVIVPFCEQEVSYNIGKYEMCTNDIGHLRRKWKSLLPRSKITESKINLSP